MVWFRVIHSSALYWPLKYLTRGTVRTNWTFLVLDLNVLTFRRRLFFFTLRSKNDKGVPLQVTNKLSLYFTCENSKIVQHCKSTYLFWSIEWKIFWRILSVYSKQEGEKKDLSMWAGWLCSCFTWYTGTHPGGEYCQGYYLSKDFTIVFWKESKSEIGGVRFSISEHVIASSFYGLGFTVLYCSIYSLYRDDKSKGQTDESSFGYDSLC